MKIIIFCCLFVGFLLVFHELRLFLHLNAMLSRAVCDVRESARQRTLSEKKRLLELQEEHSILWLLEKQLRYSRVGSRFPWLTAEWWLVGNLVVLSIVFTLGWGLWGLTAAVMGGGLVVGFEAVVLRTCRLRNLKRVNEGLLKLLDFLGNYSITSGELTGILGQVSRYMDEPIKGALEACCCEAGITGDTSLALLMMSEYIEHPKFKELARNMEISVRYCADFSAMVNSSRRSMREYLKVLQERKGMLREAFVNMAILLTMSFVMLAIVSKLIAFPLRDFLWESAVGRIALAAIAGIVLLFVGQVRKIQV